MLRYRQRSETQRITNHTLARAPDIRAIATAASRPSSPTTGPRDAAAGAAGAGEVALGAPVSPRFALHIWVSYEKRVARCLQSKFAFNIITLERRKKKNIKPHHDTARGRKGSKMEQNVSIHRIRSIHLLKINERALSS